MIYPSFSNLKAAASILKKIPVYRALSNTLDAPLLFDCLNENFSRWGERTGAGHGRPALP